MRKHIWLKGGYVGCVRCGVSQQAAGHNGWIECNGLPFDICLNRDDNGHPVVQFMSGESLHHFPRPSFHSPDGFEWGYSGSGPSDLAWAVLKIYLPATETNKLYLLFRDNVIARVSRAGGVITETMVLDWVRTQPGYYYDYDELEILDELEL